MTRACALQAGAHFRLATRIDGRMPTPAPFRRKYIAFSGEAGVCGRKTQPNAPAARVDRHLDVAVIRAFAKSTPSLDHRIESSSLGKTTNSASQCGISPPRSDLGASWEPACESGGTAPPCPPGPPTLQSPSTTAQPVPPLPTRGVEWGSSGVPCKCLRDGADSHPPYSVRIIDRGVRPCHWSV